MLVRLFVKAPDTSRESVMRTVETVYDLRAAYEARPTSGTDAVAEPIKAARGDSPA